MHAIFHLHNNNGHVTVFPRMCRFTFIASNFSLLVIQLFHSVSSCYYKKNGYFVDTNLQQSKGLVPRESAHNPWKSYQDESCVGFVFSEDDVFFLSALLLWLVSNRFRILPTYEQQVSCTLPTLSVSVAVPIRYQIWVLEVIDTAEQKGCSFAKLSQQF